MRVSVAVGLSVLSLVLFCLLPSTSGGGDDNSYDDPYWQMMMYQKYFNSSAPPVSFPSMWMCAIVSLGVFAMARRAR